MQFLSLKFLSFFAQPQAYRLPSSFFYSTLCALSLHVAPTTNKTYSYLPRGHILRFKLPSLRELHVETAIVEPTDTIDPILRVVTHLGAQLTRLPVHIIDWTGDDRATPFPSTFWETLAQLTHFRLRREEASFLPDIKTLESLDCSSSGLLLPPRLNTTILHDIKYTNVDVHLSPLNWLASARSRHIVEVVKVENIGCWPEDHDDEDDISWKRKKNTEIKQKFKALCNALMKAAI